MIARDDEATITHVNHVIGLIADEDLAQVRAVDGYGALDPPILPQPKQPRDSPPRSLPIDGAIDPNDLVGHADGDISGRAVGRKGNPARLRADDNPPDNFEAAGPDAEDHQIGTIPVGDDRSATIA